MVLSTLILIFMLDVRYQDQYHQSDTSSITINADMRPSTFNISRRGRGDAETGAGGQRAARPHKRHGRGSAGTGGHECDRRPDRYGRDCQRAGAARGGRRAHGDAGGRVGRGGRRRRAPSPQGKQGMTQDTQVVAEQEETVTRPSSEDVPRTAVLDT
jgi:hypothetical protein